MKNNKPVSDMTKSILSDMYKDVYGMRPRTQTFWGKIKTEGDAQKEMDSLQKIGRDNVNRGRGDRKAAKASRKANARIQKQRSFGSKGPTAMSQALSRAKSTYTAPSKAALKDGDKRLSTYIKAKFRKENVNEAMNGHTLKPGDKFRLNRQGSKTMTVHKKVGNMISAKERLSMPDELYHVSKVVKVNEARRGRPPKNAGTEEDTGGEHIIMQLRKSISLSGQKNVEFRNGDKVRVPKDHAHKALNKYNSLRTSIDKAKAIKHISHSHDNLQSFIRGDKQAAKMTRAQKLISLMRKEDIDEGVKEKIGGAIRRFKQKDSVAQNRNDVAKMKAADAYASGNKRKGDKYMKYAKDRPGRGLASMDEVSRINWKDPKVKKQMDKIRDDMRKKHGPLRPSKYLRTQGDKKVNESKLIIDIFEKAADNDVDGSELWNIFSHVMSESGVSAAYDHVNTVLAQLKENRADRLMDRANRIDNRAARLRKRASIIKSRNKVTQAQRTHRNTVREATGNFANSGSSAETDLAIDYVAKPDVAKPASLLHKLRSMEIRKSKKDK